MTLTEAKGTVFGAEPPIPAEVDKTLVYILSQKRKFRSPSEIRFMGWLQQELRSRGAKVDIMAEGCVAATVTSKDITKPSVMFSCHTDTVHDEMDGAQHVAYDPNFGHVFLGKTEAGIPSGSCLGADDGAGVWLMLEMVKASVPGVYLFHRGEECGGVGANAMVAKHRKFLEDFDMAVAFDRPRNNEVISHQRSTRCASDEFCNSLADKLNESQYLDYKTSDGGVFTDTYVYRQIISECINLGVGYTNQHGINETLDYGHLVALRDQCLKIDWHALKTTRNPEIVEPKKWGGYVPKYTGYSDGYEGFHGAGWDFPERQGTTTTKPKKQAEKAKASSHVSLDTLDELRGIARQDYITYVEADPEWAAEALCDLALRLAAANAKLDFLGEDGA